MTGAIDRLRNAVSETDLDLGGHKLLNADLSSIVIGASGPQAIHTVWAGPSVGGPTVPTFRLLTASEVGAQPHSAGLDLLSPSTPTVTGIQLLQIANPGLASYPKHNGGDPGGFTFLTPGALRTDINAEPHTTTLTTLGALSTTTVGQNLLVTANPSAITFPRINADNTWTFRSAPQLISDLGVVGAPFIDSTALVRGSGDATKLFKIEVDGIATATTRTMTVPNYDFTVASLLGVEALRNKLINGLTPSVGTSPGSTDADAVTYSDTPLNPFLFTVVAGNGQTGTSLLLRTTAPTSVVLPTAGILATVAGTLPSSYLDIKIDLGGATTSDAKISSQKAVKTYVDSHVGHSIPPGSDATTASANSVDLDVLGSTKKVIFITGAVGINGFTLATAGDERILVFVDGGSLITPGTTLILPGTSSIKTRANDWALVRSYGSGVVKVMRYYDFTSDGERKHLGTLRFSPKAPTMDAASAGNYWLRLNSEHFDMSTMGSASGINILLQGGAGGAGSSKILNGIFGGVQINSDTTGTGSGGIGVWGSCDSNAFPITFQKGVYGIATSDGATALAIGVHGLTNQNGTSTQTLAIGVLGEVLAGNLLLNVAANITDAVGLKAIIRKNGASPHFTNSVKGVAVEGWSALNSPAPTTSYGIYMDTSIDVGTTKYAIYSLSAASSLITGDVALGSALTVTGRATIGTSLKLTPVAFASLDAVPSVGMLQVINNSTTSTKGATIAGGGANTVLGMYSGTNWIVV